jgi:hypothetical protein
MFLGVEADSKVAEGGCRLAVHASHSILVEVVGSGGGGSVDVHN